MSQLIYWRKTADRIYARDKDSLKYVAVITPESEIPADIQQVIDEAGAGESSITGIVRACYTVYKWHQMGQLISAEEEAELNERCRFYTALCVSRLSDMLQAVETTLIDAVNTAHERALSLASERFNSHYVSRRAKLFDDRSLSYQFF